MVRIPNIWATARTYSPRRFDHPVNDALNDECVGAKPDLSSVP